MIQTAGRGLYLHIPFCHRRCHFCAFYLEIHQASAAATFVSSLLTEIRSYGAAGRFGTEPLDSVYFGGGTPTTLTPHQLISLLSAAKHTFGLAHDAEVTVEAHPNSVTADGLAQLRDAGFNRVSFGAESMDQEELLRVGRHGSVLNTVDTVASARKAGFTNINLDLMYGLPDQTLKSWAASLRQTIDLAPTHLSCYALTIEEGTTLRMSIERGTVPAPDEDLQNAMDNLAEEILNESGYGRYEISNYSRPGYACRHNRLHWTGGQYLGLGPSAQSYVGGRRAGNVSDLASYTQALTSGALPVEESEPLAPDLDSCERLVLGLRMIDGVSLERTDAMALSGVIRKVNELVADDLLARSGEQVRLTARGRRYADSVAVALLASLERQTAQQAEH